PTLTTEERDAQLLRHIKAESDRLRHLRSNTLPGLVPTSGEVNPYAASDARLLEGLWNSLHHPDQEVTNYKMRKVEVKPEPEPEPESESGAGSTTESKSKKPKKPKLKEVCVGLTAEEATQSLLRMTGGWPMRMGELLFAPATNDSDELLFLKYPN